MLVHILLDAATRSDDFARQRTFGEILRVANLAPDQINFPRFEKYGILTAAIDPNAIPRIQQIRGVDSVQVDQERRAVSI